MVSRTSMWGGGVVAALSITATLALAIDTGSAATGGRGIERRISQSGPDGVGGFQATDVQLAFSPKAGRYLAVWAAGRPSRDEREVFGRFLTRTGAPYGGQFHISTMGSTDDLAFESTSPTVVYNPEANEFLVAWEARELSAQESEIFVQRISPDGDRLGVDGRRVSTMGPDGDGAFDAADPALVYNQKADEYLIAWRGDDDAAGLGASEDEIFVQRLAPDGSEIGNDDQRVSTVGVDGSPTADAADPALVYNEVTDQYLVAWAGDDAVAPRVDNEFEIYVQRLTADGREVGVDDQRISDMGPNGDPEFDARRPTVDHNAGGAYLIAWQGRDNLSGTGFAVFNQLISPSGQQLAPNDRRISATVPDDSPAGPRLRPHLVSNRLIDEFLVVWSSDRSALVTGEAEIFAQRLTATGAELGTDDQRISEQGPNRDPGFVAREATVAVDAALGRYLVGWHGEDDTGTPASEDLEVFTRFLKLS